MKKSTSIESDIIADNHDLDVDYEDVKGFNYETVGNDEFENIPTENDPKIKERHTSFTTFKSDNRRSFESENSDHYEYQDYYETNDDKPYVIEINEGNEPIYAEIKKENKGNKRFIQFDKSSNNSSDNDDDTNAIPEYAQVQKYNRNNKTIYFDDALSNKSDNDDMNEVPEYEEIQKYNKKNHFNELSNISNKHDDDDEDDDDDDDDEENNDDYYETNANSDNVNIQNYNQNKKIIHFDESSNEPDEPNESSYDYRHTVPEYSKNRTHDVGSNDSDNEQYYQEEENENYIQFDQSRTNKVQQLPYLNELHDKFHREHKKSVQFDDTPITIDKNDEGLYHDVMETMKQRNNSSSESSYMSSIDQNLDDIRDEYANDYSNTKRTSNFTAGNSTYSTQAASIFFGNKKNDLQSRRPTKRYNEDFNYDQTDA